MIQTKFYKNEWKEERHKTDLKEASGANSREGRRFELELTSLGQNGREKHSNSLEKASITRDSMMKAGKSMVL